MTKKKSKRKKTKLTGLTVLMAIVASGAYTFSMLFMKSYNNQIAKEIQMYEAMITEIQKDNTVMYYEVTELTDHERVLTIAQDAGLTVNTNQVITITVQSDE